jgi:hypothetical protein
MSARIEFGNQRECHYGKCGKDGAVNVQVTLPFSGDGGSALACVEHVAPMASLLLRNLRNTYTSIAEGLR